MRIMLLYVSMSCFAVFISTSGFRSRRVNKKSLRVISGVPDTKNKYSFVLPLTKRDDDGLIYRICTTTLIAPTWVITAAHCVHKDIESNALDTLVVSTKNITQDLSGKRVLKAVVHPNFVEVDARSDISLVMTEKIEDKTPALLSAIDYSTLTGLKLVYVGAGGTYTDYTYKYHPNELPDDDDRKPLQIGEGVVKVCKYLGTFSPVLCIASKCSGATSIQGGDSGGPIFVRNKVAGVCYGTFEVDQALDIVYTPVTPYLDWIHNVIATENSSND